MNRLPMGEGSKGNAPRLQVQRLSSLLAGANGPSINQQVLPGQIARMTAANESAQSTELLG
jgi:hypothetical protein